MVKRIVPVGVLSLLSPVMAEYLSGSLSLSQLNAMPVLLLMYGAGAVLIRESARRFHRGWPTILLLGLAYAFAEEGIADQSLFNAGWNNLHLLDSGYIPSLGIGVTWTIYVLTIHVVWSIAAPIVVTESFFPNGRREPWLGKAGLAGAALSYAAGIAAVTLYSVKAEHFLASPRQMGASAIAIVVLTVAGLAIPGTRTKSPGAAPKPWVVGTITFIAASVFTMLYGQGVNTFHWPWQVVSGGLLAVLLMVVSFGFLAGRRSGWGARHSYAMAAGAVLVYCWLGFLVEMSLHGKSMLAGHAVLSALIVILLIVAGLRVDKGQLLQSTAKA